MAFPRSGTAMDTSAGSVPWSSCGSWITCWRTRFRSAPGLASTCAATPSPLADQAEQDVPGADVAVAELQGLPLRQLEYLLGLKLVHPRRCAASRGRYGMAAQILDERCPSASTISKQAMYCHPRR